MHPSRLSATLVLAGLVILAGSTLATAGPVYFRGLGDLPGGDFYSAAYAVSADGSTAVGYSNTVGRAEAFRWTASGGMQGFGGLPGEPFLSTASGVSADGSVIVGDGCPAGAGRREAFRWTQQTGLVGLGFLPHRDSGSRATGVSGDGSVVAGISWSEGSEAAFAWTQSGGMVMIQPWAQAYAVSADGNTVIGTALNYGAFRWTPLDGLEFMGNWRPTALSADGSVIVGDRYRWTLNEGLVQIIDGDAKAVSADGSIVVGTYWTSATNRAFVWDPAHGQRDLLALLTQGLGLDLTGWNLQSATGVSADGMTIVGCGVNPQGFSEAWIAHIPEPATLGLMALASVGLLGRRKRLPA